MEDLTEAEQQEYRDAQPVPGTDAKGRRMPETMTDREMLMEILINFRQLGDTLEEVGQNPMLKALPGMGKLFGGK